MPMPMTYRVLLGHRPPSASARRSERQRAPQLLVDQHLGDLHDEQRHHRPTASPVRRGLVRIDQQHPVDDGAG